MRYLIIVIFLFSCNPERQLQKAEVRLAQAGRLPAICADRYPVKTDTFIVTETLTKIDTFLSGEYIFDTIRVNDTITITKYKPLNIVKYKTLTKTEFKVDKAKEKELQSSVSQLQAQNSILSAQLAEYKDKAKARLNWLLLLLAAIFGYAVRKPIMEIIKWNLGRS